MKYYVIIVLVFVLSTTAYSQDPKRFENEVSELTNEINVDKGDSVYLFTGSSSIRMWKDLNERFPDENIVNTGFGGSHMSDLLYYYDQLIKAYDPDKIFIYEGDNDISSGKKPVTVLKDTRRLIKLIRKDFPDSEIYLISAKPSISRWNLKEEYMSLNKLYQEYASQHEDIEYVDVWTVMLNDSGNPKPEIFIEDDLHMNDLGYDLWEKVIEGYL